MPTMNLARPGTTYGPCQTDCNHPRCVRARRAASLFCLRCDREIGYGVDYVDDPERKGAVAHKACIANRGMPAPRPHRPG
jgi:hypothetical protein